MSAPPPARGAVTAWGLWDWAFPACNAGGGGAQRLLGHRKLWLSLGWGGDLVIVRRQEQVETGEPSSAGTADRGRPGT